jgi:hypothetical protein
MHVGNHGMDFGMARCHTLVLSKFSGHSDTGAILLEALVYFLTLTHSNTGIVNNKVL